MGVNDERAELQSCEMKSIPETDKAQQRDCPDATELYV